jgi:hypothetical protein
MLTTKFIVSVFEKNIYVYMYHFKHTLSLLYYSVVDCVQSYILGGIVLFVYVVHNYRWCNYIVF